MVWAVVMLGPTSRIPRLIGRLLESIQLSQMSWTIEVCPQHGRQACARRVCGPAACTKQFLASEDFHTESQAEFKS